MKSLNMIILSVAAAVSLLLLVTVYFLFSGFSERMMQQTAFSQASVVSRLAFSNMYQLMNLGWKRDQVIAFSESATQSLAGSPLHIAFYRGERVAQRYGPVVQQAMTPDLEKALRSGRPVEIATPYGGRYIYPLQADQRCLRCHENVKVGDVLGAVTVEARYERFIEDARKLLMMILLMLAPAPFAAAWLVTIYLDRRIKHFIQQVDDVLERSETSAKTPDFNTVKPAWKELDEVLDRFKRLDLRRN